MSCISFLHKTGGEEKKDERPKWKLRKNRQAGNQPGPSKNSAFGHFLIVLQDHSAGFWTFSFFFSVEAFSVQLLLLLLLIWSAWGIRIRTCTLHNPTWDWFTIIDPITSTPSVLRNPYMCDWAFTKLWLYIYVCTKRELQLDQINRAGGHVKSPMSTYIWIVPDQPEAPSSRFFFCFFRLILQQPSVHPTQQNRLCNLRPRSIDHRSKSKNCSCPMDLQSIPNEFNPVHPSAHLRASDFGHASLHRINNVSWRWRKFYTKNPHDKCMHVQSMYVHTKSGLHP